MRYSHPDNTNDTNDPDNTNDSDNPDNPNDSDNPDTRSGNGTGSTPVRRNSEDLLQQ